MRGTGQQPVAGAKVDVAGPGRTLSERTGSNGNALFTLPRPGTYRLSASKDGYIGLSREVEVTIGDTIDVEFTLSPHLIEAQAVTVTAGADPVLGHRRHGVGRVKSGRRRNGPRRSGKLSRSSLEWFAPPRASW